MRDRAHETAMVELLAQDRAYAAELLHSVLADGDAAELHVTLRQLAQAFSIEYDAADASKTLQAVLKAVSERS